VPRAALGIQHRGHLGQPVLPRARRQRQPDREQPAGHRRIAHRRIEHRRIEHRRIAHRRAAPRDNGDEQRNRRRQPAGRGGQRQLGGADQHGQAGNQQGPP
jgi:hypothetical protein